MWAGLARRVAADFRRRHLVGATISRPKYFTRRVPRAGPKGLGAARRRHARPYGRCPCPPLRWGSGQLPFDKLRDRSPQRQNTNRFICFHKYNIINRRLDKFFSGNNCEIIVKYKHDCFI